MNGKLGNNRSPTSVIALVALIVILFCFGGSSRSDAWQLLLLRPISVFLFFLAIAYCRVSALHRYRYIALILFGSFVLVILHLMPLPPSLWSLLPGRDLLQDIYRFNRVAGEWHPLTMSPVATRNAFWSMFAPLCVFLLIINLDTSQIIRVLAVSTIMYFISCLVSILQIGRPESSLLFFYRISNFGDAVGFFANRNHQALFIACMLPVSFFVLQKLSIDFLKSSRRFGVKSRQLAHLGSFSIVTSLSVTLIMLNGSRAGLLLGGLSVCFTYWMYRTFLSKVTSNDRGRGHSVLRSQWMSLITLTKAAPVVLTGAMLIIIALLDRDLSVQRAFGLSKATELRGTITNILNEMVADYWLLGSGVGTFDKVFRIREPRELLAPTYWNHAHNDWAELVITTGTPGLIIAGALAFFVIRETSKFLSGTNDGGQASGLFISGLSIVSLSAVSSVVDYPLRVPLLQCLFVIGLIMIQHANLDVSRQGKSVDI